MQSPQFKNQQPAGLLMIWWPVFLGLGIGAFFYMPRDFGGTYLGFRLLAFAFMLYIWPFPRRDHLVWRWISHGLIAASLGLSLIQWTDSRIKIEPLDYPVFGRLVTGKIESTEFIDKGWRVVLRDVKIAPSPHVIHRDNKVFQQPVYRVRIAIRHKDFRPEIGSTISVKASLIPPSYPLMPGMFDFRRHAYFQRLSAYGYSMSPVIIEQANITEKKFFGGGSLLERYRQYLSQRVDILMHDMKFEPHQSVVGLTMALLNGQRAGIDKKSGADMQRSGLQHLISISGFHVSLMAGIIFFCVRFLLALSMRITLHYPIKKIAAAVALIGIILYMFIVGLTAPTVRSVITSGIVLIAVMMDREAITVRMVALAASLILIFEPESLITPGFQMSFAAVAALVVFYQKTQHWWRHTFWRHNIMTRLLLILAGSVATTMVATIATAPFAVYHFQQLPVLSIIANMMVTPVMGLIVMPASILVYLTIMFDGAGSLTLLYMGYGVEKILDIASLISQSDYALWRMRGIETPHVVIMTIGGIWLMVMKTRVAWLGLIPVLCAMCAAMWTPTPVVALLPTDKRTIIYAPRNEDVIYHEGKLDKFSKDLLLQNLVKSRVAPLPNPLPSELAFPDNIYIARDITDLKNVCARPERIIITRWYVDDMCEGKTIIDRFALQEAEHGLIAKEE
jgi:competence protein ComEC